MAKKVEKEEVKEKKTKIDITKKEPIHKVKPEEKKRINKTAEIMEKYNIASVIMIALVLFIFSFIIAAQLNTVGNTDIISTGMREAELLAELQKANNKYETLKEEYDKSQVIVEEYKNHASSNDTLIASMKTELEQSKILAGLVTVKGEGVVIILQDSTEPNMSLEAGLVHDTDIMSIVNELRAAGAEAISINNHRIINRTDIVQLDEILKVNGKRILAPFTIKAIGNQTYLEGALLGVGGYVDELRKWGFEIQIERSELVQIEAYTNELSLKYINDETK